MAKNHPESSKASVLALLALRANIELRAEGGPGFRGGIRGDWDE